MIAQPDHLVQSDLLAAALAYAHRGDLQPTTDTSQTLKTRLVDLGLDALARGDLLMVYAITDFLKTRGWSHV